MLFRSNSSLFIGSRSWPQQNLITFSLSDYSISCITYQKYLILRYSSCSPPAYFVCFFNRSTSTLGRPHTINFNSSPVMQLKYAYGIIYCKPFLIRLICKMDSLTRLCFTSWMYLYRYSNVTLIPLPLWTISCSSPSLVLYIQVTGYEYSYSWSNIYLLGMSFIILKVSINLLSHSSRSLSDTLSATNSFQNILGRSNAKWVPVLIQHPIKIPMYSYNDKW